MADPIPEPPPPPPANVARFNANGTPTQAQVIYEQKLRAWMAAVAAKLNT